jgi:hypothetical protein
LLRWVASAGLTEYPDKEEEKQEEDQEGDGRGPGVGPKLLLGCV